MRIIIDQGGFRPDSDVGAGFKALRGLTFAPEAGILGQSAAVNEFTADIITDADIDAGVYMRLRDDLENLWAQYWLTSARRVDGETVHVVGQSDLMLLDRPTLPATYYSGETVENLVDEIFRSIGYNQPSSYYTLDPAIAARTLTGFCPQQTARERLQWVVFAAGAYIKSCFCDDLQILPVPDAGGTATLIPRDKVFWKPRITEGDYVTAVTVKAYRFTRAEPQSGEQYVTDSGGVTYVYTAEDITVENPNLQPAQFPLNVVSAQDVMLMDTARASAVVSDLARYYFKRTRVEADVIDNGEYYPGMLVTLPVGDDAMYTGYITACSFRYGVQARATLTIAAAERVPCANLTVTALCGEETIGVRLYTFPVGYAYSMTNDYIDLTRDGARRVFRPLTETVSGTMPGTSVVKSVQYAVALRLAGGILEIISVDAVAGEAEDEINTGVIS